jgi:transposase
MLQVGYRKVWCSRCGGVRVEDMGFCDPCSRITTRLARYIYDLCKVMTVLDVARHLDLDPKTVKSVEKAFLLQEHGKDNHQNLRVLVIDEIAIRKGQRYLTIIADYLTGRIVSVESGRNKETLDSFFLRLTPLQKEQIEAVAVDMWEPYINRIRHHCPQAMIVFDFFHLVKAYGDVVKSVRREEYRLADRHQRQYFRGSEYILLKNAQNLSEGQGQRLERLLKINRTLHIAYMLKDQLKDLYRYSDRRQVQHALDTWCQMASHINHDKMQAFIRRLKFFAYGILNHCDYPIGTGLLDGMNNKIKVIKRRAYGFHDQDYFALKLKQAFPGHSQTNFLG